MNEQTKNQQPPKSEGEITIEQTNTPKRKNNNDDGEYVDYEEVK